MTASAKRLLVSRDDAVEQIVVSDTITANGATAVSSTFTFSRAFSATPKLIGSVAVTAKDVSITVSAISATAITMSLIGLAGNTDAIPVSVTLEGQY